MQTLEKEMYDTKGHEVFKEADIIEVILDSILHINRDEIDDFFKKIGYNNKIIFIYCGNKRIPIPAYLR